LIFFCPKCWSEVKEDDKICPECQETIAPLDQASYFDKLTRALHHPVAATRMRAAYILGEIGDKRGIEPLADIIDRAWGKENLFFLREIAIALGKIDGDEAVPVLVHLLGHPSFLIREEALKSLPSGKNKLAAEAVRKALNESSTAIRELAKEFLAKNSE
jgi:HEAT repeat protein